MKNRNREIHGGSGSSKNSMMRPPLDEGLVILKASGKAIGHDLICEVASCRLAGLNVAVVHGGGVQISKALAEKGIGSTFINGIRVTSPAAMEVVETEFAKINVEVVEKLNAKGIPATSLLKGVFLARSMEAEFEMHATAGGALGEFALDAISAGLVPVLAPIGMGRSGQSLNLNADDAAVALAISTNAARIVMLTDVSGILDEGKLIERADPPMLRRLMELGRFSDGMLVKVESCIKAARKGIEVLVTNRSGNGQSSGTLILPRIGEVEGEALVAGEKRLH